MEHLNSVTANDDVRTIMWFADSPRQSSAAPLTEHVGIPKQEFDGIIGSNAPLTQVLDLVCSVAPTDPAAALPRRREISLSVSQVLVGLAAALGSMGLFAWAVVRLWLFDQ